MKCPKCGNENMTYRETDYLWSELPRYVVSGVGRYECECGEGITALEHASQVKAQIGWAILEKRSLLDGAEIRFLRKGMTLSGKSLAARMGVSNITISRWENGQQSIAPVRDRLLRLLYAGHQGWKTRELAETVFPTIRAEVRKAEPREMRVG